MLTKSKIVISQREVELLFFLWRHRVATFQTLAQLFYPTTGNETVYNRLRRIREGDFIQTGFNERNGKTVWCLGERGYRFLESVRLPELKSKGYRPNSCYHDLYAMAALLGDWYKAIPDGVDVVTEQELLTTELSCVPPKIQEAFKHRPDGLWVKTRSNEPSAIALEMETTGKSEARYDEICSFYGSFNFIETVVWIVPDRALAKKIQKSALACAMPKDGSHIFILLEDFESKLWAAKFLNSSMSEKSLSEFLSSSFEMPYRSAIGNGIETPIEGCRSGPRRPINSPLLDFSLSINRFTTYRQKRQHQNL
jgi:hypothetical protein